MKTREQQVDLAGAVWLRRDALDSGLTDRRIGQLVKSGEWHRIRRGAYCSGELWASLGAADRHRVLCRAVLLTAHPSTVLSHVSAAVEHGIPVWGVPLDVVHTTRTDQKCGRKEAGIVHHRASLSSDEVVEVNGVLATAPARAVIEVCALATVEQGLVVANGALNAGLVSPEEIASLATSTRYWPDSLNTRIVVDLMDPAIESVGESRTLFMCWSEHLPRPQAQVVIRDENGRIVGRLDFAWPDQKVWLEFDGREKYERYRRKGETLEQFLMREKQREEQIALLTGWTCLRINWADLENPGRLANRIRKVLAARSPEVG